MYSYIILKFFSAEYLKTSTLGGFFGEVLLRSIAWFIVENFKFLTWTSFFTTLGGDFSRLGESSKDYLIAFCSHIDCVSMQNLKSVALMVSEKRCTADRRTDGRTWLNRFFSSRWSRIYILSHLSPSACYIHSAKTNT